MENAEIKVGERRTRASVYGRLGRTDVAEGRCAYGERPRRPHTPPGEVAVTGTATDRSES